MNPKPTPAQIEELTKALADSGRIIEAGWVGLKLSCIPETAGPVQLAEMRKAFYAGAQHLFTSMLSFLEPGHEPTERDMDRMSKLSEELERFAEELTAAQTRTE